MSQDNNKIYILNMTGFFNRELFMYSLGDIKFKKPVSLKKVAYITLFLIIWILPMFLIFGMQLSVPYLAFLIIPPIVLGNWASRPVWGGGRGLIDYIKVLTDFIKQPRGWTDHNNDNDLDKNTFFVRDEIWISRRREMMKLAKIARENREQGQPDTSETKTKKKKVRNRKKKK